jgi:hypothetical protein
MAGFIMAGQTTNYLFDYPTSTDYVKDGATAIQELADDVDATLFTALGGDYPGMRLVKAQAVGTGVASVNVTSAFSATYENYRIIYSGGTQSNNTNMTLKLGASTTGYYGTLVYMQYSSATVLGTTDNNAGAFTYVGGGDSNASFVNFELLCPEKAQFTRLLSGKYLISTTSGNYDGVHKVATSYTDFTITPGAGTLTGGTIYVYGYGAS